MKRVRYSKYTGNLADELEMESLLEALSDFLLDSGFQSPYSRFQEMRGDQTLDNLREAMRQALEYGDLFDEAIQEKIDQLAGDGELEKLIEQLLDRMEQENYRSVRSRSAANAAARSRYSGQRRDQCSGAGGTIPGHRQGPGFSRLQNLARPARLAGKIFLRPARYPGAFYWSRSQRRFTPV